MGVDPLSIALIATAAVSTGASIYEGEKANKQAKKANQIEQQQADLTSMRQKRDAIRQGRLAMAQAQASAENQGVSASSSAIGGQGSIVSQVSDNLSFLDKFGVMSDMASKALGKAQSHRQAASTFGQVANLAMTGYANAPQISAQAAKVFKRG